MAAPRAQQKTADLGSGGMALYVWDDDAQDFVALENSAFGDFTGLTEAVDGLEALATTLNGLITTLDGHVDQLEGYTDGLEGYLDAVERAVATATATIANAASLSDAVALGNGRVAGLQLPAAWTAAAITFQGSIDGGSTYQDIYDDANERTIASAAVVASRTLSLDPLDWRAFTHIKVRSGTSAAAVSQGAQRLIVVALERGV